MPDLFNVDKETIKQTAIKKLEHINDGKLGKIFRVTVEPLTSGLMARVIVSTLYHGAESVTVHESDIGRYKNM